MTATREVIIAKICDEADGIKSYLLENADGAPFLPALPGAHVDVQIPGGPVRQYSLCHAPSAVDAYLIAVKSEPQSRGGSRWLHEQAKVGDRLSIGEPRSLLGPSPDAASHILIAGGIGITPLYSMALHFQSTGAPFELHYFARSVEQAAFQAALCDERFQGKVHFHFGIEPDALSARLDEILAGKASDSHVYMCGPTPFMDAVQAKASAFWPAEAIHLERFSADVAVNAGTGVFQVELASSGVVLDIPPGRAILDVLMANGHEIEHSCEQGFCGSCMTGVLEGEIDHRDTFLTEEELASGQWIMPCVSRARSARLVLDI